MPRRIRSTAPVSVGVREQVTQVPRATKIVDGLLAFAGEAVPFVTQELNKKVESDKALQAARALQGQAPTDDATVAGYKASYLVAAKLQGIRAAKELQADPNLGNYTDEEFEARVAESMGNIQSSLGSEYKALGDDPELAKAFTLQMTETMPALIDARYAAQLEIEQKRRYEDTYALAFDSIDGMNPKDVPDSLRALMGTTELLQMTDLEREKILLNLAQSTGNMGVFEFAKEYKGSSDSSLFSRSGTMQQLERVTKTQMTHEQQIEFWKAKDSLLNAYTAGSLTVEEFDKGSLQLKTDFGQGLSENEYRSAVNARQRAVVTETSQDRWMNAFKDGKFVDFVKADGTEANKGEKAAFLDKVHADVFSTYSKAIEEANTEEGRKSGRLAGVLDSAWVADIKTVDDLAKQSGEVSPEFKGRLNNIATFDITRIVKETQDKDGTSRYVIPGIERGGSWNFYKSPADDFNLLRRMPLSRLSAYASGRELEILERTRAYLDADRSPAEALVQANYDVDKGKPVVSKDLKQNLEDMLDDPTDSLFNKDIPESARPMMTRYLLKSTINFDSPDFQKAVAADAMNNLFTYLSDNSPIKGNAGELKAGLVAKLKADGVDVSGGSVDLDDYFQTARLMVLPFARTHFRNKKLRWGDIQFDVQDNYVRFVSGEQVLPYKVSLGELGSMVYNWKKENPNAFTAPELEALDALDQAPYIGMHRDR